MAAESSPPKLQGVSAVTWWSHDATGYHPAIRLTIENVGTRDLTGQMIRFQCLFRDIRNGNVTVGRKEIRTEFPPNTQLYVTIRGPKPFELPIDQFSWPSIECKVMCRVGDVGDEGTMDILITRLDNVTMTDEEASARFAEVKRLKPHAEGAHHRVHQPPKPLAALALALNGSTNGKPKPTGQTVTKLLAASKLAGLGDDFYDFEQVFGRPSEYDGRDKNFTWARFGSDEMDLGIFVAARSKGSKADLIVLKIPASQVQQESQLANLAKIFAGQFRHQKLDSPQHSVRYLAGGRLEISTLGAPAYKVFYVAPRSNAPEDNHWVLAMSRLPSDWQQSLEEQSRRVAMLRFLSPIMTDLQAE